MKHKEGYTKEEIDLILQDKSINKDRFYSTLYGCTGMLKNGEFITYKCDVDLAIKCGKENRTPKRWEWD